MVDELWRCKDHGKHCKGIQYLEKGQDELKQGLVDKTNELKDARKSLTQDIKGLALSVKDDYITKAEYRANKRIQYMAIGFIVLEALKRYLS